MVVLVSFDVCRSDDDVLGGESVDCFRDGYFDVVVGGRNVFWRGCCSSIVPLYAVDEAEVVAVHRDCSALLWPGVVEFAGVEGEQ